MFSSLPSSVASLNAAANPSGSDGDLLPAIPPFFYPILTRAKTVPNHFCLLLPFVILLTHTREDSLNTELIIKLKINHTLPLMYITQHLAQTRKPLWISLFLYRQFKKGTKTSLKQYSSVIWAFVWHLSLFVFQKLWYFWGQLGNSCWQALLVLSGFTEEEDGGEMGMRYGLWFSDQDWMKWITMNNMTNAYVSKQSLHASRHHSCATSADVCTGADHKSCRKPGRFSSWQQNQIPVFMSTDFSFTARPIILTDTPSIQRDAVLFDGATLIGCHRNFNHNSHCWAFGFQPPAEKRPETPPVLCLTQALLTWLKFWQLSVGWFLSFTDTSVVCCSVVTVNVLFARSSQAVVRPLM